MRHLSWLFILSASTVAFLSLSACAVAPAQPEEEVALANVPDPSMQKCATVTGSRIATTCSNMVRSTSNKSAMQEMQRHRTLGKDGDNGWGSPIGR